MARFLKVFISLTFALVAALFGVVAVALVKAVLPIFRFTAGTQFELYIQDPILYLGGPLLCAVTAFRKTMRANLGGRGLNAAALGVLVGIVAAAIAPFALPFRPHQGAARWLVILLQFPVIPFALGYAVYRLGARDRSPTRPPSL